MNEENIILEAQEQIADEVEADAVSGMPDETEPEVEAEISNEDEILALKAEIEDLRAQLVAREQEEKIKTRMNTELAEFEEYFPEISLDEIPDEVWEKVKGGASLSASYSLFKRKKELESKKVRDLNEKNRKMSAGSVAGGDGEKYYSPAEVKRMTPAQVKNNYDRILESMRHWN